jgi:peptidoglycan hydrolase-like protein with peptidoglycan-binding domain
MGEREDAIGKIVGGVMGSMFGTGWLAMAIFVWQVPWFWWATFNESGWWALLALLLTFIGVVPLLVSIGITLDGIKKLGQSAIPDQFRDEAWLHESVHSTSSVISSRESSREVVEVHSSTSAAATASINGLHAQLYNNQELSGVRGIIDEATLGALGLDRHLLGLSEGVKGEAARTMQQALLDKGLSFNSGADGHFGQATKKALKQFQEESGISLGAVVERTDSTIDFDWVGGAPHEGMNDDNFSIRWTGFLKPEHSGTYSIHTVTDDGVRLWVGGELLIDDWNQHPAQENTAIIELEAEEFYSLKMEYFEGGGLAMARLLWTPPYANKNIIPNWALYTSQSGVEGGDVASEGEIGDEAEADVEALAQAVEEISTDPDFDGEVTNLRVLAEEEMESRIGKLPASIQDRVRAKFTAKMDKIEVAVRNRIPEAEITAGSVAKGAAAVGAAALAAGVISRGAKGWVEESGFSKRAEVIFEDGEVDLDEVEAQVSELIEGMDVGEPDFGEEPEAESSDGEPDEGTDEKHEVDADEPTSEDETPTDDETSTDSEVMAPPMSDSMIDSREAEFVRLAGEVKTAVTSSKRQNIVDGEMAGEWPVTVVIDEIHRTMAVGLDDEYKDGKTIEGTIEGSDVSVSILASSLKHLDLDDLESGMTFSANCTVREYRPVLKRFELLG